MSVLSATTQKQVEENLVKEGLLTPEKLADLKAQAEKKTVPLLSYLVSEGHLTNESLTKTIAKVTKVPYVNLTNVKVEPEVLSLLPQDIAERYMAVPLGEMQHRLVVAMLDADNVQAVDFLSNKIGRPLKVYAASEEGIRGVLKQYEARLDHEVADAFGTNLKDQAQAEAEAKKTAEEKQMQTIVQDSPISKALASIFEYAAHNRASDIHIEPMEKELKIRCRIDGVLREIIKLPKSTEAPLVSRIKILSNLKIDEHRIPQDGQFTMHADGKDIDLRIAIGIQGQGAAHNPQGPGAPQWHDTDFRPYRIGQVYVAVRTASRSY
jgi:type IV pilus assembly protein PilB